MINHRWAILIAFSFLGTLYGASPSSLPQKPHILLIDSYHQGFSWSEEQARGIKAAINEHRGIDQVDFSIFHLDNRLHPAQESQTIAYFRQLYSQSRVDLIMTTDNYAWDFMRQDPWRLQHQIPLVFAGVNNYQDDGQAASLLLTGVAENFYSGRIDTLKIAETLLPETRSFVFLLDSSATSLAIRKEIEGIQNQFADIDFRYVVEDRLEAQIAIVKTLKTGTVLIPVGTHSDGNGDLFTYEEAMEKLSVVCSVPSFGFIENRIGHGMVGGKILTGYDHGYRAGEMAAAILGGKSPAGIPVLTDNPGSFTFDWRQLDRFKLDESRLPAGSRVINRPSNFFLDNQQFLLINLIVMVFLAALVIVLVISRRRLQLSRQSARESQAILESYIENSPDGIFVVDEQGRYIQVNRSACSQTGYSREQLLAMSIPHILAPGSLAAGLQHFETLKSTGQAFGEIQFRRPDGSLCWMSVHSSRIADQRYIGITHDIGRRIKDSEQVRHSLQEKETLLRELYHRTKNNMYIINSLLELHEPDIQNPADRMVFREMATRIQTMALVHEKLYGSEDLSHIDFGDYVRELALLLHRSYDIQEVAFKFDLAPVQLTVDTALPLGLVLNELLTNSLRHGLSGSTEGLVEIRLQDNGEGVLVLDVSDNGKGFAAGFKPHESDTMGLKTIISIVEHQLQGSISWNGKPGVTCSIRIPLASLKVR